MNGSVMNGSIMNGSVLSGLLCMVCFERTPCRAYAESPGIIFNCIKTVCMMFKRLRAQKAPSPHYWHWMVKT